MQKVLTLFKGGGGGALKGPLMGGPQCRLSILRNGNVPLHYSLDFPVDFKMTGP